MVVADLIRVPPHHPPPLSSTSSGAWMKPLPIDPRLPEILDLARAHRSLVLVAPPGAGKTTRVPVAIVENGLLSPEHPALVLLQPRRVAARASAARIAEENGFTLGDEVG